MIHYSGVNDLLRIYYASRDDGIDYNLAFIGDDFTESSDAEFDEVYMNALYAYGHDLALNGYPWRKAPIFISERANDATP
jgi:hypothetical protein